MKNQSRLHLSTLESLTQRQQLKVEELKQKTAYYTTKELLDRYELDGKGKDKVVEKGKGNTSRVTERDSVKRNVQGHF